MCSPDNRSAEVELFRILLFPQVVFIYFQSLYGGRRFSFPFLAYNFPYLLYLSIFISASYLSLLITFCLFRYFLFSLISCCSVFVLLFAAFSGSFWFSWSLAFFLAAIVLPCPSLICPMSMFFACFGYSCSWYSRLPYLLFFISLCRAVNCSEKCALWCSVLRWATNISGALVDYE